MDEFEISVRKTEGGIGSDTWTASFTTRDGASHVHATGRGASRAEARSKLSFELTELSRQINSALEDLSEPTKIIRKVAG
jgi:hypothetical protein